MKRTSPMGSLSSGLLARKGHARPAMRGAAAVLAVGDPDAVDDLGWNDMGGAESAATSPSVPAVLADRAALAAAIATPVVARSVSVPTATRLQRETAAQGKAAFTLRVDPGRHLRLRLAGALTNRSAQDLMTQALDALIDSIPEVATLVAALPQAAPGRTR